MSSGLPLATASSYARIALGHVTREYPNKLDHVMSGPADVAGPRSLHPIFYGSFDWHSCVHGYWLLLHLYRTYPSLPEAGLIRDLADEHLTDANVRGELAYLERPASRGFERPYGWAWLLALAAELARHTRHTVQEASRWSRTLSPLAEAFATRMLDHLPHATYPIRAGTHASSAFAVTLALDYAVAVQHEALERALKEKAIAWYEADRDCQAWEPGGDDFLSPALMEAECMRRVLPAERFEPWLDCFLPRLARREPASLFRPATVSDRSDGKIAHLDGLNLSRAWCFRGLAKALAEGPARAAVLAAADEHLAASLPHVSGDYMGEHWLATFALLASTQG
jgi:hypothetical protein